MRQRLEIRAWHPGYGVYLRARRHDMSAGLEAAVRSHVPPSRKRCPPMQRSPVRWSSPLRRVLCAVSLALLVPALALAQANGKLQIHHMKIGQGDGILLISPLGQTALFDDGVYTNCTYIKSYIQGLNI